MALLADLGLLGGGGEGVCFGTSLTLFLTSLWPLNSRQERGCKSYPHPKAAKQSKSRLTLSTRLSFRSQGRQRHPVAEGGARWTTRHQDSFPRGGPRLGSRATTTPHRMPNLSVSSQGD